MKNKSTYAHNHRVPAGTIGYEKSHWFIWPIYAGLFVIMVFMLSGCSFVSAIDPALNQSKPPAESSSLESTEAGTQELRFHPDLVQGTLSNGLRYILMKNAVPEGRVSMHLDVQVGSMHEKEDERGIAHYLEHMVFNGSTHYKPGELVEYFQSIGMMFGPDANAHTGFYETVYDIFLPGAGGEQIAEALTVLSDYAQGALLLPEETAREKGVILAEKRERDSASYRTFAASLAFELPGSRLPERLPIGTHEVISGMDQSQLKRFYDTWYRPENMVVVMVGDMDLEMAESLVRKTFSDMQPRSSEPVLTPDTWSVHQGVQTFYHPESEAGNVEITIETVRRVPFEPETLAMLQDRVLEDLGHQMLQNRLSRDLTRADAPFSDAGAYSGTFLRDVHFTAVAAETDADQWRQTLARLDQRLRQALEFGFQPSELDRVKADMRQLLESAAKKADSLESTRISRDIIYHVNHKKVYQSPRQELEILGPFLSELSLETVNDAFREAWRQDHRLIKVTGNVKIDDEEMSPENRIKTYYERVRSRPVNAWMVEDTRSFPYLNAPEHSGQIILRQDVQDLGIVQVDFDNGLRLNVKQTDFKPGSFLFEVNFGPGRRLEPRDLPGLGLLAQGVINDSGLGDMNQTVLETALAGRDVTFSFDIEQGGFHFTGNADPDEMELVMQLLQASMMDPGFRQEALALNKERYRQGLIEMTRSPQGMMSLAGEAFLAGGDQRFGMPAWEYLHQISLDQIKQWLEPWFYHAPREISIVGDVDVETVVEQVARYLGALPAATPLPEMDIERQPRFPAGMTGNFPVASRIEKGMARLAFLTDDFWKIHQTRRLSVLSRVLSERLRKQMRETLGVTYSPYAYNDSSEVFAGYGVLHSVVSTAPEKMASVMTEMIRISDELARDGVQPGELDQVIPPILTHIRDLKKKNRYWLSSVLSGSLDHPEQIKWASHMYDDYAGITEAEISDLAVRFLNPDRRAGLMITVTP